MALNYRCFKFKIRWPRCSKHFSRSYCATALRLVSFRFYKFALDLFGFSRWQLFGTSDHSLSPNWSPRHVHSRIAGPPRGRTGPSLIDWGHFDRQKWLLHSRYIPLYRCGLGRAAFSRSFQRPLLGLNVLGCHNIYHCRVRRRGAGRSNGNWGGNFNRCIWRSVCSSRRCERNGICSLC